jgi:hypothetical protein
MSVIEQSWGRPDEVFRRLVGTWKIERSIEGHGTLAGEAVFAPTDDGMLAYRERGELRLDSGAVLTAEREYLFARRPGGLSVFFAEKPPRLFHEVILTGGEEYLQATADHLCNADHYRSDYAFKADGSFVIRHVVRGPKKDYAIVTVYTRGEAR